MTSDLGALVLANFAIAAAGLGVLRLCGFRPALIDLAWSLGLAYVAGAAAVGLVGSLGLVLGLALPWWQLLLICAGLAGAGLVRRTGFVRPAPVRLGGWMRLLPAAVLVVLAVVALDLVVQPIWTDDAWSIWAAKARSIVLLGGLDADLLTSDSVANASYPLLVPVLEVVAIRSGGLDTELIPLQLGLLYLAFPWALAALLRERVRPLVLWTVLLAFAVAPTLQIQTASAVADVPLAVFFAFAGVAGWRWVEEDGSPLLWLSGLFAAAAVATKVEGRIFVALLFAALAVAAVRHDRPLRRLALAAAAVALSALPWELWARASALEDAVSRAGGLSPGPFERITGAGGSLLRELADPSSWLALVALAVVAVGLAVRRPAGRDAALFTAFVVLSSLAALVVVYWTTPLDFDYHVATSVRRVITAPAVFAAAMAPLLLSYTSQSQTSR